MGNIVLLADNVRVEVDETPAGFVSGHLTEPLSEQTIDSIRPILVQVQNAIASVWDRASEGVSVESTEIELGLKVDGEAGWILAKASVAANLKIKMTIKRNPATKTQGEKSAERS